MSAPLPAIVLLAAGTSSRFGTLKQLQLLQGILLVRRAALSALETGLPVWLVTGAQSDCVQAAVAGLPLRIVENRAWEQGMGSSLALGVREAAVKASAVLVMLADQALITAADLDTLLAEHAAYPQSIIAADHGEALGPPCVFPAEFFAALQELQGDRGARALLKQHEARVRRVPMLHAAVDVDTADDLVKAESALAARQRDQPGRG